MSLIDLASLVLAPTAVKDGKVYNAIPNDQDFTFSRGTEATRVNSAGLIEKARTNFLRQSNTFNTTWSITNASVTGGQADKDGGTDAWLLQATTTGSSRRVYQSVSIGGGIKNLSVYAKAGTTSFIAIECAGSNGFYSYFNLSTGTKGTYGGSVVATSIESVGSGWYRISVSGNPISLSLINLLVTDGDNSTAVTSGANVYIQDAQTEQGLVATDYIETTTSSVTVGITDDLPRVDYSGGGCPSLLLEPQRTNTASQSEYLNGILSAGGTITDNVTTSPEGLQNAGVYVENTTNTYHRFNTGGQSYTQNQAYTFSVFAKSYSGNRFLIVNCSSAFGARTYFDLSDGTKNVVSGTADIQDYKNGWYRCSVTGTRSAATGTDSIYFGLNTTEADTAYTGDGTSGMYFWGAMLEAGSYSTSYIPTYGTSTSRSADSCSLSNASNLIGQSEGTLFAEFENINTDVYTNLIPTIHDGTSNNFIKAYYNPASNGITAFVRDGGSLQVNTTVATTLNDKNKIAFAYKQNDFIVYLNGSQIITDTSGTPPSVGQVSLFDNESNNSMQKIGGNQAILFPTRLTNDQLAELTK